MLPPAAFMAAIACGIPSFLRRPSVAAAWHSSAQGSLEDLRLAQPEKGTGLSRALSGACIWRRLRMRVRKCSRRLWRSAAARVLACLCEGLPSMSGNRHLIFCHCLRQEIGKAPCVPSTYPFIVGKSTFASEFARCTYTGKLDLSG